jgi:hypothetical protein
VALALFCLITYTNCFRSTVSTSVAVSALGKFATAGCFVRLLIPRCLRVTIRVALHSAMCQEMLQMVSNRVQTLVKISVLAQFIQDIMIVRIIS